MTTEQERREQEKRELRIFTLGVLAGVVVGLTIMWLIATVYLITTGYLPV